VCAHLRSPVWSWKADSARDDSRPRDAGNRGIGRRNALLGSVEARLAQRCRLKGAKAVPESPAHHGSIASKSIRDKAVEHIEGRLYQTVPKAVLSEFMSAFQKSIHLKTQGHCDVIDITAQVQLIVVESGVETGIASVAGIGSTLAITTLEYEPGCVADLRAALDRLAPPTDDYAHNRRWGDHNGYSHLRSALLGTAKSFPVRSGHLALGTWQQIVLCDLDDGPRHREVIVTVVG
jgi:secondary thiamine-phosphate synthase enzyme